jgi:hypothetical protein
VKAPRLAACVFGDVRYPRLARVLEFSARRHCPEWTVDVCKIKPVLESGGFAPSHQTNTAKLDWWTQAIRDSEDGDRVLLIDADTMVIGNLDPAWEVEFDVAYTTKVDSKYPFNAGVIFVRVNERSRAFIERWCSENRRLFVTPKEHHVYREKYAGMNQASLGCMLEAGVPAELGLNLIGLPCSMWNCEDTFWGRFRKLDARIVHIKSALRKQVFKQEPRQSHLMPLIEIWEGFDREGARAEEEQATKARLSRQGATA